MPKDYQISQYDQPINVGGHLDLPDGSRRGHRARPPRGGHRQVDPPGGERVASTAPTAPSSTTTAPACRSSRSSRRPTSRSAAQARAYVAELRAILVATGASDGRMEEGSMRVDANVSIRRVGEPSARAARSRTSTRCAASRARSSTRRSARSTCSRPAGVVAQETRHWDESTRDDLDAALQGGGRRLPVLPRARPGRSGAAREWRRRRRRGAARAPREPARPPGRAPRRGRRRARRRRGRGGRPGARRLRARRR